MKANFRLLMPALHHFWLKVYKDIKRNVEQTFYYVLYYLGNAISAF